MMHALRAAFLTALVAVPSYCGSSGKSKTEPIPEWEQKEDEKDNKDKKPADDSKREVNPFELMDDPFDERYT